MNISRPAAFSPPHAAASAAAGGAASAATAPGQSAANANEGTPAAGSPGFIVELANDPLGIVADYLPQSDKLVMRQASGVVRQVVDATIHRLTLAGHEARGLFARPDAFRHLRELCLTHCDDAALVALADVLRHGARPAFDLVLDREAVVEIGATGLRAIAPLHLSRLALRGLAVPPEAAMALAGSSAPVSVSLPFANDRRSDLHWIGRIPTLTSLSTGMHELSAASVASLRSHPALTVLQVAGLSAEVLRELAGSPRLQSLSVTNGVGGPKARAFAALANTPALTSLDIGKINLAADIATLARSRTLSTLTLHLGMRGATAGLPALAAMPALAHLSLQCWDERLPVAADDIAALCAKPLASLRLETVTMDAAAFAHVAAARAGILTWEDGRRITHAEAAMLGSNPHLSSLTLGIEMVDEAGALLLARAPGLRRLDIGYASDAPELAKRRVMDAWATAGKVPADLRVDIFDDDEDAAVVWV